MTPVILYGAIAAGLAYWQRDRIMPTSASKTSVRLTLRAEARAGGFPPDWFDAIAKVESGWVARKVNNTGGDGLYGGSYGPMQMTAVTARRLGYDPVSFLTDVRKAGQAAVKYLTESSPTTFMDAVAYWNGGVKKFQDLYYGGLTVTDYWPKALDALEYVQANPPKGEGVA